MAMKSKTHHNANANATNDNNVYNCESSESATNSNSPSPPPSPRRHSTNGTSHCRRRLRSKTHSFSRQDALAAAVLTRRSLRYLLLLPMLYVSGLLMCVGPFSGLVGHSPLPGSVYRSHEIFQKLWADIQADNSSAIELSSVWKYKRRLKMQKPCPNSTAGLRFAMEEVSSGPSGYLIVEANGGLNQQRSAICNAVAVAGLLNAILVIPQFEFNSVWKDARYNLVTCFSYYQFSFKGYPTCNTANTPRAWFCSQDSSLDVIQFLVRTEKKFVQLLGLDDSLILKTVFLAVLLLLFMHIKLLSVPCQGVEVLSHHQVTLTQVVKYTFYEEF
ncbi:uncharacterized protein LOC110816742 [Carica papaya]|uniref:uncharacterized protein LOC110816742 n=1 Tax=Carica papaya TaxID=3649 RepID=UPI000B8C930B|nr:uncharacterized protein LOC110816742 [Carica papaya]